MVFHHLPARSMMSGDITLPLGSGLSTATSAAPFLTSVEDSGWSSRTNEARERRELRRSIGGLKVAVGHAMAVSEGLHCQLNFGNAIMGHEKGHVALVVAEDVGSDPPVRGSGYKVGQ